MKKLILILSVATVALMLVFAGGHLANRLSPNPNVTIVEVSRARGYNSLKELVTSPYTNAIVRGVVIDAKSYREKPQEPTRGPGLIFTDYLLEVQLVVKGSLKVSDVITIHQTGGAVDGETMIVRDDPPLCVGDTLILFLHEYEPGKYYIEAGPQGRFVIQNGLVYSLGEVYEPAEAMTRPFKTYGQSETQFINSIISILKQE
jgi:hypothetical protein